MPLSVRVGLLVGAAGGDCVVRVAAVEESSATYCRARQAAGRFAARLCRVSFIFIHASILTEVQTHIYNITINTMYIHPYTYIHSIHRVVKKIAH